MRAPGTNNTRSWSVAIAAIVIVLVVGAVSSLVSLFGANAWIRHTADVRIKVGAMRSTLIDAESAVRGYVATGASSFLEPYETARASWSTQLDELRMLTTDNPLQQERLHQLRTLIDNELEGLAAARAERYAGHGEAALLPILRDEDRAVQAAREMLGEMEREEIRLDVTRRADATRNRALSSGLFITGALAFLIFMTVMARQRRAAEAGRARAEDQRRLLDAVFSSIDDGITLQDRSGRLAFANASAARLVGFPSAEALLDASQRAVLERFELFDEEGHPFPIERLPARAVLAGAPPEKGVLVRYRRAGTGPWKWSMLEAYPIKDAQGQVVQAISVFRDVTAERAAEERDSFLLRAVDELSSSLEYETTLASVARLAVPVLADWCAVDIAEDGRLKRVATAHVDPGKVAAVAEIERRYPSDPNAPNGPGEVLRTGRPQLIPTIPRELLVASAVDDEHLRLIEALELSSYMAVPLVLGGKVLGAITFAMAESQRVYGEADLGFARALADRAALAIANARLFREVEDARAATTDQLVAEEHRRAAAEEQARFAETFVGMLGHDLRNPLNAITITARLLLRGTVNPREMQAIERILSSSRRMSSMVTQLLDLTRSRLAGGIPIQRTDVEMGALVSEVVDELKRTYPARIILWTQPHAMCVAIDRDRLAQVVSNLLGNALEHGDASRPVRVEVAAREDGVTLTVHNEGPPISPELLPILFEPFRVTRGDRSRGLGLGLFITKQIVLAHGGRVDLSSTASGGTTFQVFLPGNVNDEGEQPAQKVIP